MDSTSYVFFTDNQLKDQPELKAGDVIACEHCKGIHITRAGDNQTDPDGKVKALFYSCGGNNYIAGINGKSVIGLKPVKSGTVDLPYDKSKMDDVIEHIFKEDE